jgi:acetamidase/formamidase
MSIYSVEPEQRTLHGSFSRERQPILTIESGDTVRFRTLEAGWGLEAMHEDGSPRRKFEPRDPEGDQGHALCGSIAIRGAEAGMTLAVEIEALQPGTYGWTSAHNDQLGIAGAEGTDLRWTLDTDAMIGRNQYGHGVKLRPFMGVMGMPVDEPGYQSTIPPRFTGGNIDCKELVVGSTLYLPIAVTGGLFSVGDGHAIQADGEVSSTAIECPMEHCELTFQLHENLHLTTPRAHTPAGWITFGFHQDLDEALVIALDAMLGLMGELYGLNRLDALGLASLVVDMRVTQVVNQVRGIHAVLPHHALHDVKSVP